MLLAAMIPLWLQLALLLVLGGSVNAQGREELPGYNGEIYEPIAITFVNSEESTMANIDPIKVNMKYMFGDWSPHFGYRSGHWAINHQHRKPKDTGSTNALNPYLVRLVQDRHVFCGGIVVSRKTVITAASCLQNRELADIDVKVSNGHIFKVLQVLPGEDYTMRKDANKLSLLHLDETLDASFSKMPPICVNPLPYGGPLEFWSWDKKKELPIKHQAEQLSDDVCRQELKNTEADPLDPDAVCVENTKPTTACEETFGLPLVWQGRFCGINVSGHNCPNAHGLDQYVKLFREKRYMSRVIKNLVHRKMEQQFL